MKKLLLLPILLITACGQPGNTPFGGMKNKLPIVRASNLEGTIQKVGSFSLLNQYGDTISNEKLRGKIYLAGTFNTTCISDVQKSMLRGLAKVQRAFKDTADFYILSFSMDPEKDSLSRLTAFCKANNITGSRRYLLTGPMTDSSMVYFIRHNLLLEVEIAKENPYCGFIHTDHVVLVDRQGKLRVYYNLAKDKAINQLTEDVQILLKE